ncbi:hypothetical protein [Nocardioides yefusunii]|uniref:Uncharacterized protein n=1 Tax=Nocardioides yefusunii TaxID=2500546 RepID=A0ABW1QZ45_9ACTN|nr:hypothetical protein [Nocardioides yefusunii]
MSNVRYFTPEMLGPVCRYCRHQVPLIARTNTHPTCGPEVTRGVS